MNLDEVGIILIRLKDLVLINPRPDSEWSLTYGF